MDLTHLTLEQLEELAGAIIASDKARSLGPFILGSLIDALSCGILLMQCGSYISSSARDRWLLKATVACVVTMNLWGTAFAWAWVWEIFVRNFGTYRTLFSVKYLSWLSVINSWTGVAVQIFFALRAWKILNRNRLFGVVLIALMLGFIGSNLAIKIQYVRYPSSLYTDKVKIPLYINYSSLVAGDVLITITIFWNLLSWRGGNRRTDRLLKKLARVTFESQLPPTLVAITGLVIFTVRGNDSFLIILIWALPKAYGISLLHTLNMRPELAQQAAGSGATHAAPSCTTGTDSLRFAVKSARTAQTGPGKSDITARSIVISVSQSQSHFGTPNRPQESALILFDKESVATTLGDTPKMDVLPAFSYNGSSDIEMEMVESKSRLPDLESHATTTG